MAAGPSIAQALAMIGAGCVGGAAIAWLAFKVAEAIERAVDETFAGDCWNVPPEAMTSRPEWLSGAGEATEQGADPSTQLAINRTHGGSVIK